MITPDWFSRKFQLDWVSKNWFPMKKVTVTTVAEEKVKIHLNSTLFEINLNDNIVLLEKCCEIILQFEMRSCTLSTAVELWNNLTLTEIHQTDLIYYKKNASSLYGLAANLLDPRYRGKNLSLENKNKAKNFIFNNLFEAGALDAMQDFLENKGIFKQLEKKDCSPKTFWKFASDASEQLSDLAIKLMQLPASAPKLKFKKMSNPQSMSHENHKMESAYYYLNLKSI